MKHVRFFQVMNFAVGMWLCDMWLCLLGFDVPYLSYDPRNHPSGGNNYNCDKGVKPSMMTHPSGNNNNVQSTPTGSTPNRVESHDLICFRCGKKGHMSKYCPDPPWVFAAQVIQEDKETPQTPDNNESHDAHEIHEHKSNRREETEEAPEHSVDPNGSQYDSGNDELDRKSVV